MQTDVGGKNPPMYCVLGNACTLLMTVEEEASHALEDIVL